MGNFPAYHVTTPRTRFRFDVWTYRKWMQRYLIDKDHADLQRSENSEAEAEIRRLKRELETVQQERDILKKALQVFSWDQKL